MKNSDAKTKANEYAGGIIIKRAMQAYMPEWTVTPTTNFSDNTPCRVHWDLTATKGVELMLIEGKARSRKYRVNNPRIQDMQITGKKLDWVREAADKHNCRGWVFGVYPYDNVVLVWPADKEYEECVIYSKDYEMDDDSEKTEKPGYILPFDEATRLYVDGSDFDENWKKAYRKYTKK